MSDTMIRLMIAFFAGLVCLFIPLLAGFMIETNDPRAYVLKLTGITIAISYIIGILFTFISRLSSSKKDKGSVGLVFAKAGWLSLMVMVVVGTFAVVPVMLGILPPKFQSTAGEGMTLIGAFRGIPESMMPAIGADAIPWSEMFYAFWGGMYGQVLASSGY